MSPDQGIAGVSLMSRNLVLPVLQQHIDDVASLCQRGRSCCAHLTHTKPKAAKPGSYHLVLYTRQANLSLLMRQSNGAYTQRFNRRHGKVGHVFQGRFKAIPVDREAYLLELFRFVELNPVRAGMV